MNYDYLLYLNFKMYRIIYTNLIDVKLVIKIFFGSITILANATIQKALIEEARTNLYKINQS